MWGMALVPSSAHLKRSTDDVPLCEDGCLPRPPGIVENSSLEIFFKSAFPCHISLPARVMRQRALHLRLPRYINWPIPCPRRV